MISKKIDKALKSIYKIGGIYFGDYDKEYLTEKFIMRSSIAKKCKAEFYCYIVEDHLLLYDTDSNTYPVNPQLLIDLFPDLIVTPVREHEFIFKEQS